MDIETPISGIIPQESSSLKYNKRMNKYLTKDFVHNDLYIYENDNRKQVYETLDKDEKVFKKEVGKKEEDPISEIIKYMSSPLRRVPSYQSEAQLLGYPTVLNINYKRGCENLQQLKLTNVTLEPIFVRLHKVIPEINSLKFLNLSKRPSRIPTGLSFMADVIFDAREPETLDSTTLIVIAFKDKSVRTYQICPININFTLKKPVRQFLKEFAL